jgi:hypothetical protein
MRSEKTYAPYAADGIATKAAKRGGFIAARDQAVVKLWMSEDSSSELPAESSAPAAASMSRSTAATAVKQLSSAPASVNMEVASCPWAAGNRLVRIALGSGSAPGEPSGEAASVQIRFDPKQVAAYRVLSEGRSGSGGALIEIIPADVENEGARRGGKPSVAAGRAAYAPASVVGRAAAAGPLLTLITSTGAADWRRVREHSLSDSGKEWKESSPAFLWSAGAAGAELLLEDSPFKGTATWKLIEELVRDGAKGQPEGRARQMFELIEKKKAGK